MSGVAIVAVPSSSDLVWDVSSEKIPHMTLLYLGDALDKSDYEQVQEFVTHVANTTLTTFGMGVEKRGTLGKNEADVLFFRNEDDSRISLFRSYLLQDDIIREAYESTEQFEGWTPHLTLGYPESPAKEQSRENSEFYWVNFAKLMIWTGEYEGPEIELKDQDMTVAMDGLDEATAKFLEHYGVKGQRWGVRKADKAWATSSINQANAEKHMKLATPRVMADLKAAEKKYPGAVEGTASSKDIRAYNKETVKAVQKHLQETADEVYGESPSGRKRVQAYMNLSGNIVVRVMPSRQIKVQHSIDSDSFEVEFHILRDDNGFVIGFEPVAQELAQSELDAGTEFLEHYGIKGQRWGVRRTREQRMADRTQKIQDKAAKSVARSEQITARANARTSVANAKTAAANARLEAKLAKGETKIAKEAAAKGVVGKSNRESKSLRDSAAKEVRTLDDQTLRAYSERINTEKKLKAAIKEDQAPARSAAKKLIADAGKDVAKTALVGAGSMALFYMLGRVGERKGQNPRPKIKWAEAGNVGTNPKVKAKEAFDFAEEAADTARNMRVPKNKYPAAIPTTGRAK